MVLETPENSNNDSHVDEPHIIVRNVVQELPSFDNEDSHTATTQTLVRNANHVVKDS